MNATHEEKENSKFIIHKEAYYKLLHLESTQLFVFLKFIERYRLRTLQKVISVYDKSY